MLSDAIDAFEQIFTPPFRAVLWKSLALTLVLLAFIGVGVDRFVITYVTAPWPWLDTFVALVTGLGLFVGLAFLVPPVTSLTAGFFLDELAETVERAMGPEEVVGKAMPGAQAIWLAARFAGVSVLVNLFALLLLLLPGINLVAFFGANAYLLGREYFELAALRYRPIEEVRALRSQHALYLFACGFFIAALVAIPVVNLLTPLFGTAFMVRVHRRIAPRPASRDAASSPQASLRSPN
jgi:CysZ protein